MAPSAFFAPPVTRPHSAGHRRGSGSVRATERNLKHFRTLREKAETQLLGCKTPDPVAVVSLPTPQAKELQRLGGLAAEEHMKRRAAAAKDLAWNIEMCVETIEQSLFQSRKRAEELLQTRSALKSQLMVAEARAEMRTRRPRSEQKIDIFQEALQAEITYVHQTYEKVSLLIHKGRETNSQLDKIRSDIQPFRVGGTPAQVDRAGGTKQLLADAFLLEEEARKFCKEAEEIQVLITDHAEKMRARTVSCMKTHIGQLLELRRQMEQEIKMTSTTLADAERQLERTSKELARVHDSPEKKLRPGKRAVQRYKAINAKYPDKLLQLRSKIKGAAYLGHKGRQVDLLFSRWDKDQSGELDEDELRRAFRRTIRIPPALLSDAEIHALYKMLDEDKSGTVSIGEVVQFLESDVSAESLDDQCRRLRETIDQLRAAKHQMMEELRSKTASWHIDCSCSKVTAKSLEVAGMHPATPR
eukprot:TRINITY_DN33783_c0_g1_i1.p1 TRINITY_DN33783_c0_g1~~TRINITY_DN33783_c0_g1_i1.p1  ORF type:complete len:472 (-),score=122.83 TRINITY_DN33783_c0_g1_i1:96-1511(-)